MQKSTSNRPAAQSKAAGKKPSKSTTTAKATKKSSKQYVDKYNNERAQQKVNFTEEQARKCKRRIIKNDRNQRHLIETMFYGGCRALGQSFSEFVKSLPLDHSTVYRQLNAAIVEHRLGYRVGTVKESVVRDMANLPVEPANKVWDIALAIMKKNGSKEKFPTAKLIRQVMKDQGLIQEKTKSATNPEVLIKKISGYVVLLDNEQDWEEVAMLMNKQLKAIKGKNL